MLSIPGNAHNVKVALFMIFSAEHPYEYGDDNIPAQFVKYVDEVKSYRRSIDDGKSFEYLLKNHLKVVLRYPFQVRKQLGFATAKLGSAEWEAFQSPHGLVWRIYQAHINGDIYVPSDEDLKQVPNITNSGHPVMMKVFKNWKALYNIE